MYNIYLFIMLCYYIIFNIYEYCTKTIWNNSNHRLDDIDAIFFSPSCFIRRQLCLQRIDEEQTSY